MKPYTRGFNDCFAELNRNNPYADKESADEYDRGYDEAEGQRVSDLEDIFEDTDYRSVVV